MNLDRIRELRARLALDKDDADAAVDAMSNAELDAALAAAEALARLEAWLLKIYDSHADIEIDSPGAIVKLHGERTAMATSPTLLAALTAALDQAEAKP